MEKGGTGSDRKGFFFHFMLTVAVAVTATAVTI